MRTIPVKTNPAYAVTIGPGLLRDCGPRLRELLPPCHMAVVTDSTVGPLYLETVTESLKATDQMKWVGMMNNIRQRAEETVMAELIYA